MRVLTVGNLYPPHHYGGLEQVWRAWVAHARARGHEVHVLCTDHRLDGVADGEEPGVDRALDWYWRDHDFARFSFRARLRLERRNHDALRRHLHEQRPDVVAFWSMGGMSHSLIERVRREGIPALLLLHDVWLDYGRHTDQWTRMFARRPIRRLAPVVSRATGIPTRVDYARAGRCLFVSHSVRRRVEGLGLGLADTAVVHAGIAPLFLEATPERDWGWRLLHVGRLHPDKGIHDAVAALARLPEATLSFAGAWDPREERALVARAGELGVAGRVAFLGHRTREQVAADYAEHDAVLFPVVWEEPWGLVPLEAMGRGRPVVATGRGGSGEYLRDGENCVLVPAEDPAALAAGVQRLAADAALRARLRAAGLATAARHTEPIFNEQLERHAAEVAARGGAPTPRPAVAA